MRTTVTLAPDVAAAVESVRRADGVGVSEAINGLIRAGLEKPGRSKRYKHRTHAMGAKVDLTNLGDVLDLLDEA